MKLGILSDTHGLLRPEVFVALDGVDHIVHAGDVGSPDILTDLAAIAPVTAVWGNTDGWDVRRETDEVAEIQMDGVSIVVVHGHQLGAPTPAKLVAAHPGVDLIVFGHTHEPLIERVADTLVVNPGSAGARRFRLPVSVARGTLEAGRAEITLVTLIDDV